MCPSKTSTCVRLPCFSIGRPWATAPMQSCVEDEPDCGSQSYVLVSPNQTPKHGLLLNSASKASTDLRKQWYEGRDQPQVASYELHPSVGGWSNGFLHSHPRLRPRDSDVPQVGEQEQRQMLAGSGLWYPQPRQGGLEALFTKPLDGELLRRCGWLYSHCRTLPGLQLLRTVGALGSSLLQQRNHSRSQPPQPLACRVFRSHGQTHFHSSLCCPPIWCGDQLLDDARHRFHCHCLLLVLASHDHCGLHGLQVLLLWQSG